MGKSNPVVLFLVDGLRSDGLDQAETPHMDNLIREGAHTFSARTVVPSMTLPCLTSLIYSMDPNAHGVTTNVWQPPKHSVPGLYEVIFRAGLKSAVFINWEQLRDLHQPGSLEALFYINDDGTPENDSDEELAELAVDYFIKHRVDFAFVYFHQTDAAGHREGWMSAPYLSTIAKVDRCIGKILDVIPTEMVVIVTSDHGGKDSSHGMDSPEETNIPLIIRGPGIPGGYQIKPLIRITDIAPTIISLLGIESPIDWTGKALTFTL